MSDRNYTCVASAMQRPKGNRYNPSVKVGDTFTTNQGCIVTITKYESAKKVHIVFNDEYQYRTVTAVNELKSGQIANPYFRSVCGIGYIDVGEFKTTIKNKHTKEYFAWMAMLRRCYSEKMQAENPTYIGCTVCNEWHSFQNFAKWYTSQEDYGKDYQLDKDLLVSGNKIYSPETCVLAPQEVNLLFVDRAACRGDYPLGVSYMKRAKKFRAYIGIDGKYIHLGYFDNPNDAHLCFLKAKKDRIKQIALRWKSEIDERLFKALMQRALTYPN